MGTIVENIVISKLFLDNEIIALVKIPYMTICNNILFYITSKVSNHKKNVLKKIDT